MMRYYASAIGQPFTSDRGLQYFAWDEGKSIGSWVSARDGRWISSSGITLDMSVTKRWKMVEPFLPPYLELDEGL